ncbi:MAG: methyl-accepting chemotaxis protein [Vulcanimicrobiota bacterium]
MQNAVENNEKKDVTLKLGIVGGGKAGSEKVYEILRKKVPQNTHVINSRASNLLHHLKLDEQFKVKTVKNDITGIKNSIKFSMSGIGRSLDSINRVALDLSTLAINARIEAARAGHTGKGFAVVANEVKNSAQFAVRMVEDISNKSFEILEVSNKIDISIEQLDI